MKHPNKALCTITICSLLPIAAIAAPAGDELPLVQGSFGMMILSDQDAQWGDLSDEGVDVDFSNLPVIGLEAEYVFHEGWIHWGFNPGGSIGWQGDGTNFSGRFSDDSGAEVNIELENSLFVAEIHMGGYIRGRLTDRVTTYAAAGPMLMYAEHTVENEQVERTPDPLPEGAEIIGGADSSAFDIGYYARAGIDFEVRQGEHMGLGFRYLSAELDFDDSIGTIDVEGPQVLFTYSRRY
ncbi:MAG: hypothetical protein ACI9NT_002871 [Bacteroidia bacterium]|jgi:hypothetical protein